MSIAGTNPLAYFSAASVSHKKSFITLTPESNVLKLFYFVTDTAKNRIIIIALSIARTNTVAYFAAASVSHTRKVIQF